MKRYFCLMVCCCLLGSVCKAVMPGVGNFNAYRSLLEGKKVGIVANQTSVCCRYSEGPLQSEGQSALHTVDFLREQGICLEKIFCPEHGFRGDADAGEIVGDYRDPKTGLPVISLYGKKKKPTSEDLQGLDVLVFDIQDVGVRFYTYLSTLHYVMEACAENQLPLIVMDRPNPNAFYIDGPVLEGKYRSFVGMHPVPVVYGMTIGEYARMINGEGWLKDGMSCELTVIPCENWTREMTVSLPRSPSPNLPDSVSVMLYPSVCLFEGTVVSEGRGTYTPFQLFGHPALKGMTFSFTPQSIPGMSKEPKCLGQLCYGLDLRDKYEEVKAGRRLRMDWLLTAYRHYAGKTPFFTSFFEKLAGTEQLRRDIEAGKNEEEIRQGWEMELQRFCQMRERYLIY